jgi:adenylate cyclase
MKRRRLGASVMLPLVIAALAVGGKLAEWPPIEEVSLATIDFFQRMAPRPAPETPTVIVDIDEASLKELGQWPWPRTVLADLFDKLAGDGVAVIGFDGFFPEPDRTSPQRLVSALFRGGHPPEDVARIVEGLPDNDKVFADSISRARVVLGSVPGDSGTSEVKLKRGFSLPGGDPLRYTQSFPRVLTSLPELDNAAAGVGTIDYESDWDGLVRRVPLVIRVNGKPYPSLVGEILRVALGAGGYLVHSSHSSGEFSLGSRTGLTDVRIGPLTIPTDAEGNTRVAYRPVDFDRRVSVADVVAGKVGADLLKGRIVLVGSSAAGLNDLRATPVGATVPGVEVHAQMIDQALQGWFQTKPDWAPWAEIVFIGLMAALLAVGLPRLGAIPAGAFAALGIAGAWGFAWWAYRGPHLTIDPAYPSLVTLVVYGSSTIQAYLRSEAQRREIKATFSRYMAPALVEELAAHPERLALGGEIREMTILFSDIRGFTSIAEGLGPQELTTFINGFLDPMSETVLAHNGMIDKYIGDCIMALWNAPLPDPRHAENAVAAAQDMRRALATLNAERQRQTEAARHPFKPIRIGIGLNTGDCCVGNMGSHRRMDYSVLGDAVNLASRLEGASKTYGVDLILSESTALRVPGEPLAELDLIRVKGKDQAVRIFTLLDLDAEAAPAAVSTLLARHRDIRTAYLAQDWDRVLALISETDAGPRFGLDPLYALYRARIARFRIEPPGAAWDGVYTADEK